MKVRQDFVTNSSSTSFGAATLTGMATAVFTAVGISAASSAEIEGKETVDAETLQYDGPDRDFDPDDYINSDVDIDQKLNKLDREIEEYEKEWESTKDTLEGEDYDKSKKAYDEYIDHLKNKKDEAEGIEYEKQIKEIEKEAELEYKNTWIDERKKDLESTKEQIEFIKANIKGYGGAGFKVDEAKRQLEMFKSREKELNKVLKKEGVEHDYKARKREDIGPSASIAELMKKVDDKYDVIFKQLKKEKMDRKKKEIIKRNIKGWREESKEYIKYSSTADRYLKTAEVIQQAADVGVDALEKVTGPTGKIIKKVYVGGKAIGGGAGEAWADPENAASHIAKGTIKAAGDVAKEFTDNQLVKDGINIVSETSQGAIDSYQKGEDISSGVGKGLLKAAVDGVVDRAVDKFLPNASRDIDFGNYSGKEIFKGIVGGNPTIKEFLKDSFKDSLKNNTANQLKNMPKGDGFIFSDYKAY